MSFLRTINLYLVCDNSVRSICDWTADGKRDLMRLTFAGSDFSVSSLKVCDPLDMVFLLGVVVPSCEGRTNSILPPSTTMLGAGGKFSALPTGSQYPRSPAFSPYKGWICLQQSVKTPLVRGLKFQTEYRKNRDLSRRVTRLLHPPKQQQKVEWRIIWMPVSRWILQYEI